MGQIIPFPVTAANGSKAATAENSADILIFTGIRIERHEEDSSDFAIIAPAPTRTGT